MKNQHQLHKLKIRVNREGQSLAVGDARAIVHRCCRVVVAVVGVHASSTRSVASPAIPAVVKDGARAVIHRHQGVVVASRHVRAPEARVIADAAFEGGRRVVVARHGIETAHATGDVTERDVVGAPGTAVALRRVVQAPVVEQRAVRRVEVVVRAGPSVARAVREFQRVAIGGQAQRKRSDRARLGCRPRSIHNGPPHIHGPNATAHHQRSLKLLCALRPTSPEDQRIPQQPNRVFHDCDEIDSLKIRM